MHGPRRGLCGWDRPCNGDQFLGGQFTVHNVTHRRRCDRVRLDVDHPDRSSRGRVEHAAQSTQHYDYPGGATSGAGLTTSDGGSIKSIWRVLRAEDIPASLALVSQLASDGGRRDTPDRSEAATSTTECRQSTSTTEAATPTTEAATPTTERSGADHRGSDADHRGRGRHRALDRHHHPAPSRRSTPRRPAPASEPRSNQPRTTSCPVPGRKWQQNERGGRPR